MRFLLLLLGLISFHTLQAQLAGTFTINPNKAADSTNYQSFQAAIGDLKSGLRADSAKANGPGISDDVTFLIADGIYETQFAIEQINGTSDTSRIFFRSASEDSSKVIIRFPSSTKDSANFVLHLRYAYYLNFSHLTFQRTGKAMYGNVISIMGGRNNTFSHCAVKGVLNSNAGTYASAIYVEREDRNNFFSQLYIDSAEYGFFYYSSSGPSRKNRIENCIFNNIGTVGISLIDQDSIIIKNNTITGIKDEFGSGIKMHKCFNPQIIGNKITLTHGGNGIDDYETKRISTARGLIANNMISVTGGRWATGMSFYNTEYMDLVYNSVYIGDKTSQKRIPLVIADASTATRHYRIYNNIFANYSDEVAILISQYSHNNFDSIRNNNYYSSGFYFAALERSFTTTLYNSFTGSSGWNSAINDKNGLNVNPLFFSATDLHTESILLNGKGKPWPTVNTDIDKQFRDSLHTDIGADEFKSFSRDIALLQIEKPIPGKCEDSSYLNVKLVNNGADTLKAFTVSWKINGIVQDTFSRSVKMAPGAEVTYTIGKVAWPVNTFDTVLVTVIDTADKNRRNDTISVIARKGLKGTFTLGTDTSDYPTFDAALNDLYTYGVCGNVNFEIADGEYNKRLEILPILGAGKNSRITFRSASKDSTKVILTKASDFGGLDSNFVLCFNGADYISFENVSIIRSGNYYYGQAVLFHNQAKHNSLKNCIIEAGKSSSSNSWVLTDMGFGNDSNLIENNVLRFGFGPVLLGKTPVSTSTSTLSYGNIIKNNVFDSAFATGLKFYYQEKLQFIGNTFVTKQSGFDTAIYLKFCNYNVNIGGNYINLNKGGEGIILDECYASYYNFSTVNNNMILIGGNTGKTVYGLQLLLTGYIHINNNSIRIDTGSHVYSTNILLGYNTGTPIYPGHRIFNNILVNESRGWTIFASSHTSSRQMIDSSNNNVFYSGNKNHIVYNLATSNDLKGWNTFSGNDNKSIFLKPTFTHKDSLFTYDYRINGLGTPIAGITTDIEGDKRNTTKPDIGADEFELPKDDAFMISVTSPLGTPCKGFHDLKVRIRNMGTDTLKNIAIGYNIDGVFADSSSFTISVDSYKDTILNLGKVYFGDSVRWFTIYNMLSNNNPEINKGNDTLKIALRAAFNGTYIIGDSSYYPTFKKAIYQLDSFGVCGPVVFKIKDGKYNERLLFNKIKGASRANNITFESLNGDSSKVIVWSGTTQTSYDSNYVVLLDSAHDITFKKITLGRQINISDGKAIEIRNNAARLQFLHCQLEGARYADKFSHVINTSLDCDSIVIKNNRIKFGYNGINFKGLGQSNRITNVVIENNIFDSIQVINISMEHVKGLFVRNNKMLYGNMALNLSDIDNELFIERNHIHSRDAIAISITGAVFSKTNPGRIVNNMVIIEGNFNVTGIRIISALYMDILHNTVKVISTSDESVPLAVISYSNSYFGHRVINNILVNTGPGHAIYFRPHSAANTIPYSDYNALYTNGKYIGRQDVINYATHPDWIKALKTDSHSVVVLPLFKDSLDLHVLSANVDGKAIPLATVKTDIDNQTRSGTKPDIGADEFNPMAHDIAIKSIFPATDICGDTATHFGVVIENQGANTETNFKLTLDISGAITATLDSVYKANISPSQVDTVYFSKPFNTMPGGNYNFKAWHALTGDLYSANDTLKTAIKIQQRLKAPVVKDTVICAGTRLVIRPAKTSGSTLNWFDLKHAAKPFLTLDSLVVNKIYRDTFFYVSASSSAACESYRTLFRIKFNPKPKNADLVKGSSYSGIFNSGKQSNPDEICEAALSEYFFNTPNGFSDKDYGKTWKISYLQVTDITNNTVFGDTNIVWPSSANTGTLKLNPSATGAKKSLEIKTIITDLLTGCDTILERYVDVVPLPKVKWSIQTVCEGEMVNFTDSSTGGVSYLWTFGDGGTSTAKSPGYKYLKAGTYMAKLKITNSTGCSDSLSQTIVVQQVPVVNFKIPLTVCEGEALVPQNLSLFNDSLSYLWDFGDTFTSSDSSANHSYTTAGTYKITLSATTRQGCSRSLEKTITVKDKPEASFTFTDSACVGENLFFRNLSSGASSHLWVFATGDTFTSTNVNHSFDSAGDFSIQLIAKNPGGCTDTFTGKITVLPLPVAAFEASNICVGDTVSFFNKSNDHNLPATYAWDFGDGNFSNVKEPKHLYLQPGTYNVKLKIQLAGRCSDSIMQKVSVGALPQAAFTFAGACLNNEFVFLDRSRVTTGKIISRRWSFGDGNYSTDSLARHSYVAAGKYKVTLEVITNFGCIDFISDSLDINQLPVADFNADTVCEGTATSFTNSSTHNYLNLWLFGDGDSSTSTSPLHTYAKGGTYNVILVVRSAQGCTDSFARTVVVRKKPSAQFTYSIAGGGLASFTALDQNLSNYLWKFGDGDTSTAINPSHTYSANGNYTVTLITNNAAGCIDSVSKQIAISSVGFGDLNVFASKVTVYPNPFKNDFVVQFELLKAAKVNVVLFDLQGKEILRKELGVRAQGLHEEIVHTNNAPGTYLMKLQIDGSTVSKKIISVK